MILGCLLIGQRGPASADQFRHLSGEQIKARFAGNKNYGFVGAALWRKTTDGLNLDVEVFHQSSPASTVKASTGLDIGAIYDLSETWHMLGSIGTGLQNRREMNLFLYYVAVSLTF